MKIYVILVTYNGMKWINECLSSLLQGTIPISIIIVDNASEDGTAKFVSENYKNVILLKQNKNLGFGIANNIGVSYALDERCDYVFLLNQDAFVKPDTIEIITKVAHNNPGYGIISPIHLSGKGDFLDESFLYYIKQKESEQFITDCVMENKRNEIYSVNMINAAAWLLPKYTLETVGGFDPIFFLYGEDDNYCQRVLYHGLKIGITPLTSIRHDSENNYKTNFKKGSDKYYDKFFTRVKVRYGDVNTNQYKKLKSLPLYYLKEALLALVKLNASDFKVNLKKGRLVASLNLKESVLLNRQKNTNYL